MNNHQTIEFLARDHIAELRGDVRYAPGDPGDVVATVPRWRMPAVRRVMRTAVAALLAHWHGSLGHRHAHGRGSSRA